MLLALTDPVPLEASIRLLDPTKLEMVVALMLTLPACNVLENTVLSLIVAFTTPLIPNLKRLSSALGVSSGVT